MTKRKIGLIIGVILFLNAFAFGFAQDRAIIMNNTASVNEIPSDEVIFVLWDMAHTNDGSASTLSSMGITRIRGWCS